jgi:hypothetical protein
VTTCVRCRRQELNEQTFDDYRALFPNVGIARDGNGVTADPIAHQRCDAALRQPKIAPHVRCSGSSASERPSGPTRAIRSRGAGHLPFSNSLEMAQKLLLSHRVRLDIVKNLTDTVVDSRMVIATNTIAFGILSIIRT